MMKVLGIITARSGSKGIPMKNISKLAGKPLIEYTISAAKSSKMIDKLIVSTDSKKIASISKSLGAEVPFIRPRSLAKDTSLSIDVVKHALQFLHVHQSYIPDIILILQPTSPLRTAKMIDKSIKMLQKSHATSVLSVAKVKTHPYISFWYDKKYLKPFKTRFEKFSRRQKYPVLYHPTGSIYVFWHITLQKYNSIYGPKIKPLVENEFNPDIDDIFDLFVSEMKILHWKNYKKRFSD